MLNESRRKEEPIQANHAAGLVLILCFAALVGACHGGENAGSRGATGGGSVAEHAYHPPPEVLAMVPAESSILIDGNAAAGARVRVAAPGGAAITTRAGRDGSWRMVIPRSTNVRLFGLSMVEAGRTIQSEGYLAIPPGGPAAQLRAGSGALVFTKDRAALRLLAVDYDRKGGAVVSGVARPGAVVTLRVDGAVRGQTTADFQGRFSMAFDEPPFAGGHTLAVSAGGAHTLIDVPAEPMTLGQTPFDASSSDGGWRIVWMTPGGGLQTTLVLDLDGKA